MAKFGMYVKFTAQAGRRDDLVGVLVEAAASMEQQEGCELYVVNVVETEPDTIWVTEVWSDVAAHQASLTTEECKAMIQRGREFIAAVEKIDLVPVGGKGLQTK